MLLIAPTGAGKTLAGFLPSLTELADRPKRRPGEAHRGIHTLYISPLKALAVDIERNLGKPVGEMGLPVTMETRTGDTPAHKRQRQKLVPPDILLTTPEQLALLIASSDARRFFEDLRYVVLDELHSLVTSKRGHLLSLGLARLRRFVPGLQAIGLSATVAEPDELRRWLVGQNPPGDMADLITVAGGAKPDISILDSRERVPWQGHSSRYAIPEIYELVKAAQDDAAFRQHAQPGRAAVQRALAHQRGHAADRAASRLARRQPAPPRREGDGDQQPARHRRHLDARPRHRLGRRRSRRPCRRAEGRQPAGAAHRPRQPPHGRAVARRSSCRPTASRCWSAARRSRPATSARRTRRRCLPARSTCCRSMCWAAPAARRSTPIELFEEVRTRRALCRPRPPDLRPRRRFRRDRRLCAAQLRALRPHPQDQGRAVARSAIRASPSNTG